MSGGWWLGSDGLVTRSLRGQLIGQQPLESFKQTIHSLFSSSIILPRSSPLHSVWRLVTVVVTTWHGVLAPGSGGGVAQVLVNDDPPGVPAVPAHPHRALHPAPATRHRAHGRGALGPTVSATNNYQKCYGKNIFDTNL